MELYELLFEMLDAWEEQHGLYRASLFAFLLSSFHQFLKSFPAPPSQPGAFTQKRLADSCRADIAKNMHKKSYHNEGESHPHKPVIELKHPSIKGRVKQPSQGNQQSKHQAPEGK